MVLKHLDDVVGIIRPLMAGFPGPWGVAGGWALDLVLGRVTRAHADVELAIFREDQGLLHHHFPEWMFEKVVNGQRQVWRKADRLVLPVHEIHGRSAEAPGAIEFLLNERDGDDWVYRRNAAVRLSTQRAVLHLAAGIPVLAPEIVLLFKSKSPREKDSVDLVSALPALDAQQRRWLVAAISTVDLKHPWLRTITAANGGDV